MTIILFLLGISVGSFLNVVIDRIPAGKTVLSGRSFCDACRKTLAWYELVPILSFLCLRGKCRTCKSKLSWQYPVVEVITGLLFISTFYFTGNNYILLVYLLSIFSGLLAIFMTDLKYKIIPDHVLVFVSLLTCGYILLYQRPQGAGNFVSALVLCLFFLLLFVVTKGKGLGFGDVKYAFFMGLFLGFPKVVIGFYTAFLTGAVVSVILIIIGKKKFRQTVPFGPFLVIGTGIAYIYGDLFWSFFRGFIGI